VASKLMGMGLLAMAASAVWRLNPTWHGNTIGISHGIIRDERYKVFSLNTMLSKKRNEI
jgi:hypothetical protein